MQTIINFPFFISYNHLNRLRRICPNSVIFLSGVHGCSPNEMDIILSYCDHYGIPANIISNSSEPLYRAI